MKSYRVYKAHSRLGLINVPHKQSDPNIGVEEGPDGSLSSWNSDNDIPIDSYRFSTPEEIDKTKYLDIIAKESKEFADLISKTIQPNEIQIVLGGNHSVSFLSLLSLLEMKNPQNIGHIQFVSHTDLHLVSTSPSGNFHGMQLRPLIDRFHNETISSLVTHTLPPSNLLYIGNLDSQDEEIRFMKENYIKTMNRNNIDLETIQSFMSKFPHLHINFDIDVFDSSISPATGTPPEAGFFPENIFPILSMLAKHPSISIDLVEVNPKKSNAKKTSHSPVKFSIRFFHDKM